MLTPIISEPLIGQRVDLIKDVWDEVYRRDLANLETRGMDCWNKSKIQAKKRHIR